jgi:hypothetical protein
MTVTTDKSGVDVERFARDPFADHSSRFPLSRTNPEPPAAGPSPATIRPWGLGGMRTARQQGDPLREAFTYDHARQVAFDGGGRPLTAADPTADKVSSNDGDEGPSEDYNNDYAPDSPFAI